VFEDDTDKNMTRWHGGKSAHAAWGLLAQCVSLSRFRLVIMCNISSQRFTKQTWKTSRNRRMQATQKKKAPRILYACCLHAYSRSASREMWIQCVQGKFWAREKCTDSSPIFICSNFQGRINHVKIPVTMGTTNLSSCG